jgi:hypothetical protein
VADVEATVDTKDLLKNGRGENEAIRVDVNDKDDCFVLVNTFLLQSLSSRETDAKQRMVTLTMIEQP